jgi:hypothetical protein
MKFFHVMQHHLNLTSAQLICQFPKCQQKIGCQFAVSCGFSCEWYHVNCIQFSKSMSQFVDMSNKE